MLVTIVTTKNQIYNMITLHFLIKFRLYDISYNWYGFSNGW